ncbi:prepilin-type N-terminal cleavage/methylation domain-containing protein [Opitutaceae bacterium TAV1]|nr:prepilin-type N-terminal cleavage/methylation domain-containing protein [Opitutaceae bacterium TAV1]
MKTTKAPNVRRFCSNDSVAAFTLIELLTVIAIIALLAAIIIPVTGKVRATARNVTCISNMRNFAMAMNFYSQDNKDTYPDTTGNWVFTMTGWGDKTKPDYLGIRYINSSNNTSLITVSSGRDSLMLCKQNVINSGLISSSGASTYALTNTISQKRSINAAHPTRTALAVESALDSGKTSWELVASPSKGMAVNIHGSRSNVVYLDGHVASVNAIPPAGEAFWEF